MGSEMCIRDRSEEAKEAVALVDDHSFSQIYEYKMDENMKEIHFFVEELKDGKLTSLAQGGGAAPSSGSFAILINPDEITMSWEGGKYSCLIDTTSGYTSSLTSHLNQLSSVTYNEKTAVAALAGSQSNSIETFAVTDYDNLLELSQKEYDRVLFITAAFTDFSSSGELLSYGRRIRDASTLSGETIKWLERFNGMKIMEQLSLSYMPPEFTDLMGTDIAVEDAVLPVGGSSQSSNPEDWLLMVDGALYRGTAETGPMGDSGCVDGKILSVIEPEERPRKSRDNPFCDCPGSRLSGFLSPVVYQNYLFKKCFSCHIN